MLRKTLSVMMAVLLLLVGTKATANGNLYMPSDGKSFDVTDKDIVRIDGPSPRSTGIKTTVTVEGRAKVTERSKYAVVNGKPITVGGGALEFDVTPEPGTKGKVKVTVTKLPPGSSAKPEVMEYEFEVK